MALLVARRLVNVGDEVIDAGLFNMFVSGRARLVKELDGIVEISRPPGVVTANELAEKHAELFLNEDEYKAERRRRREEGK